MRNNLLVVDLDGTLADNGHRMHLLPRGCGSTTEQWAAFNCACSEDTPIAENLHMVHLLGMHRDVCAVTGRAEHSRTQTENWVATYVPESKFVIMRSDSDHRKAVEYKRDVFLGLGLTSGDVVMEDDPSVIKMLVDEFECTVIAVKSKCSAVIAGRSQQGSGVRGHEPTVIITDDIKE